MNRTNNNRSDNIDVLANDVSYIRRDVTEIKNKLDQEYVTKEAFEPVKKLVYGLVCLILIGVVTAILAIVLKK